jgi:histidinol dehydrogenase
VSGALRVGVSRTNATDVISDRFLIGSALTVDDFVKQVHVVTVDRDGFDGVASVVETLAAAEGFDAHAESVRLRVETLRGDARPGAGEGRS